MDGLDVWVIYDHPSDYPDGFIARMHNLTGPTSVTMTGPTLEDIRAAVQHVTPYVLTRIERDVTDDAVVVESWI
ncbi:MAG: hypothetical protein WKG03_00315 [Telluria sp.]